MQDAEYRYGISFDNKQNDSIASEVAFSIHQFFVEREKRNKKGKGEGEGRGGGSRHTRYRALDNTPRNTNR